MKIQMKIQRFALALTLLNIALLVFLVVEHRKAEAQNVAPVLRGRELQFSRIMYTTLFVKDQDKALDFYTKMFGFEKRTDNPGPGGRFLTIALKGQGPEVLLWPGTAGRADAMPGTPPNYVPGVLFIESDDLRKDFEILRSRGVNFAGAEPEDYPFGVLVTALDPDGNYVSLRQTRKR
jgi:catechol 2,3-dioxygenase-like lactoylglutathione lyase family enzyme